MNVTEDLHSDGTVIRTVQLALNDSQTRSWKVEWQRPDATPEGHCFVVHVLRVGEPPDERQSAGPLRVFRDNNISLKFTAVLLLHSTLCLLAIGARACGKQPLIRRDTTVVPTFRSLRHAYQPQSNL